MSGTICSIICGAPDGTLDRSLVEGLVICADKGLDHALAAGITPDIVVGDFDSTSAEIPAGTEVIRVSPIKDDTDCILAADTAIARGCTQLRLFCALGGRLDHTFANIQTLEYLRKKGVKARLYGVDESAYLLHEEETEIPQFEGYVSVFSYGENTTVSEYGMKYPLVRYRLDNTFPLGVSNEICEPNARIIVHAGTALVIEYHGR